MEGWDAGTWNAEVSESPFGNIAVGMVGPIQVIFAGDFGNVEEKKEN